MNKQHTEYLTKHYPLLYSKVKYFECSDGWFELINETSEKLESLIKEQIDMYGKGDFTPCVAQVKEKYGKLCIYMMTETNGMSAIIDAAEEKSRETCEECGEEGKLRKLSWIRTLCDRCL